MRIGGALLILSLGAFVGTACQHRDNTQIDKDDDKPTKKKPKPPEKAAKVPEKHRTTHGSCPSADTPAPGTVTYGPKAITPPGPACKSKADCKDKANGRCSQGHCTYDNCYEDKDCGKTVCECRQDGINGYFCKGGDCAVDADCGANGYCSPSWSMTCGAFSGVVGFYCHTASDECTDDSECVKETVQGYCAFDSAAKHWRCGYGHCVG
jgi:hypothetical protein